MSDWRTPEEIEADRRAEPRMRKELIVFLIACVLVLIGLVRMVL